MAINNPVKADQGPALMTLAEAGRRIGKSTQTLTKLPNFPRSFLLGSVRHVWTNDVDAWLAATRQSTSNQ
jgi:hypothetical protein